MTITGNSTNRVRDHRSRLKDEECMRLDLTVGADLAEKMKAIARKRRVPLWHAAQEAFELFVKREEDQP